MPPKYEGVINSMIGEGSVFQGKFFVHGSLQIDGKFEGEVRTEEHLIIGETGKIRTEIIRAKKITVAGVVIGDIEALEEVRLVSTGRVLGNVTTPQMLMEPGVVVQGKVLINGGQKKDVAKLIEDSYNAGPSINFDLMFDETKQLESSPESKVRDNLK